MAFPLRRQPLKILYILAVSCFLVVQIPVWAVLSMAPSWRPRPTWGIGRTVILKIFKVVVTALYKVGISPPVPLQDSTAQADGFVWIDPTPELLLGEIQAKAEHNEVKPARTGGFWYRSPHGPAEKIFYYFHGGGFVTGSASPKDINMRSIYGGLMKYCPTANIFGLEYRVSSSEPYEVRNPFPAALIDAIAGYRFLIAKMGIQPQDIIISGDSAGGSLAHALMLYILRTNLPDLPPPGALLLLSPTVDWGVTHDGPGSSMRENARADFVGPIFESGYSVQSVMGRLDSSDISTNEWLSPGSLGLTKTEGLFSGFPRTLIVSGGAEMTLDGMRTMKDRMTVDMGASKVTYLEVQDAIHDFIALPWYEPERSSALQQIADWFKTL